MKYSLLLLFFLSASMCSGQFYERTIIRQYNKGLSISKEKNRAMVIFLGQESKANSWEYKMYSNDTLATLVEKELTPLFFLRNKDKRVLRKKYNIEKGTIILALSPNEEFLFSSNSKNMADLTEQLIPYAEKTMYYFSPEYEKQFKATNSEKINEVIQTTYDNSSRENTRRLTIAYLKEQESLLSPVNYQLVKALTPIQDEELVHKFMDEMKPEMYTQEMAEKIAYELLLENNFSFEETQKQIKQLGIPFEEEVSLYLTVSTQQIDTSSFKERKENCFDFILASNTHDFKRLRSCFDYLLRNGNGKQLSEIEDAYMFSFNRVPLDRSLVYGDLLAQLYLKKGNMKKFIILTKRNEILREKYLTRRG